MNTELWKCLPNSSVNKGHVVLGKMKCLFPQYAPLIDMWAHLSSDKKTIECAWKINIEIIPWLIRFSPFNGPWMYLTYFAVCLGNNTALN